MAEWDDIRNNINTLRSGCNDTAVLFICDVYIDFLKYIRRRYRYATMDGPDHVCLWYEYLEEIRKYREAIQ